MRTTLLVIKHEIIVTLRKRSFWAMTFLFPLIILLFTVGSQLLVSNLGGDETRGLEPWAVPDLEPLGYVDRSGLIDRLPATVPSGLVTRYEAEQDAREALGRGEISEFYVVGEDYLEAGTLDHYDIDYNPLSGAVSNEVFRYVISYNLLGDEALALAVADPVRIARLPDHQLRVADEGAADVPTAPGPGGATFALVPYLVMFILFFILTSTGGFVLQSVAGEKENRTAEVLLVSLRPRDLMLGKVLGLGVISLVQVGVWLIAGTLVFGQGREVIGALADYQFTPAMVLYGVAYLLLGYLLYASALGAIGALAANVREAVQWQMLVLAPLIAPLMLNFILTEDPGGALSVFFSIFPFTSPVSMLMRMTGAPVPTYQALLGLVLLAATAYVFVLLSARFFRADTLLSGAAFSLQRLAREFRRAGQEG